MLKSNVKTEDNVRVAVRRFIPDPNGKEAGAADGQRGNYSPWFERTAHNLLTDAGRDMLLTQGYDTTGIVTNGGNYIALTCDTGAPADADTDLTGEITDGGLTRAIGAVAHVAGNNTSTVTKTFTASAAHTGVIKSGLFTLNAAGTMVHEATFSSVNLQNNDQLQITWTITLDD